MAEVAAKQRKHKMSRLEKKNTLIAYSFLAPNFLGFAIFTLVPVVCAILLAFVEWNGGDISNAHLSDCRISRKSSRRTKLPASGQTATTCTSSTVLTLALR